MVTRAPRTAPAVLTASGGARSQQVSGNRRSRGSSKSLATMSASGQVRHQNMTTDPRRDHDQIVQPWQREVYRHLKICGEARYALTLFAHLAARAEIGISEPQSMTTKAAWIDSGPEVEALAEIAPTVRERTKLIRTFMLHWQAVGECYLIARDRVEGDPGYIHPPEDFRTWEDYLRTQVTEADLLDPEFRVEDMTGDPNKDTPLWEIVAVTEIRKTGSTWEVRHENGNYLTLRDDDPIIRFYNPDPDDRSMAWSPFQSLLPTLREIEYLTSHIFAQVKSRLMSAGVWFLPENLTYPPPPPGSGIDPDTYAAMNEAEQFMTSLAASSMQWLEDDEVAFPTVVMAEAEALQYVDQNKLIQFWSKIDEATMSMRSDAVRRFALGADMPPEQILGASGLAVTGGGGSAGSVNHWGVWANEEQTISAHVEPALDAFTGTLTIAYLHSVVPMTKTVIGYDTASLRLRQDRSKESMELYDRGLLSPKVTLRENRFDPETDMMSDEEFRRWLLVKIAGGSASPDQVQESLRLLGVVLEIPLGGPGDASRAAPGIPGTGQAPNLDGHPRQGPPVEQHDHSPAPFSALVASAEGLVLRALEKGGNRLLNDGKRGRNRDRTTALVAAHTLAPLDHTYIGSEFDFSTADVVFADRDPGEVAVLKRGLGEFCAILYNEGLTYDRDDLIEAMSPFKDGN